MTILNWMLTSSYFKFILILLNILNQLSSHFYTSFIRFCFKCLGFPLDPPSFPLKNGNEGIWRIVAAVNAISFLPEVITVERFKSICKCMGFLPSSKLTFPIALPKNKERLNYECKKILEHCKDPPSYEYYAYFIPV